MDRSHFPKQVITDEELHVKTVILQSEEFETAYAQAEIF